MAIGSPTTPYAHGQCRLTKSGANLLLSPYNGDFLRINGTTVVIPDAGVTLAPAGLTPDTTYFIYAFLSGATLTLEASTTGHAKQAGTGVEIKSGDATRTLVGMARAVTGPAWVDSDAQRLVLSWFNRRTLVGKAVFTADRTTASTTFVELNTEIRVNVLTWADEYVRATFGGAVSNADVDAAMHSSVGFDGATGQDQGSGLNNPVASKKIPFSCHAGGLLTEGFHFVTGLGLVTSGTGSWLGSGTVGQRSAVVLEIQG